jgi:hypothetical protein
MGIHLIVLDECAALRNGARLDAERDKSILSSVSDPQRESSQIQPSALDSCDELCPSGRRVKSDPSDARLGNWTEGAHRFSVSLGE